ncbi:MAG: 16S rRNA processing protein RimM [Gemmatimonadales bacterium]|nr:MAG: 16S rRNA processing protein RimM [Gemmatimonadales bacterium]
MPPNHRAGTRERSDPPEWMVVGFLSRCHGTRGQLMCQSLTDRPDHVFQVDREFRVADAAGEEPDEFFPPAILEGARPHQNGFIVSLRGLEDRSQAEFLKGRYLLLPFDEIAEPEAGEFFYHELLGMTVATAAGQELGVIREVYPMDPADLLFVSDGEKETLIPFRREWFVEMDRAGGRLVVDPPEGLLDL